MAESCGEIFEKSARAIFVSIEIPQSTYVGTKEVLPDSYANKQSALLVSSRTKSSHGNSQSYHSASTVTPEQICSGHDQGGIAEKGYTADQACIALDEEFRQLWVMLSAPDDSNVDFKDLNPKEKAEFNGAK